MTSQRPTARGAVIILLDSLRADFESFCAIRGRPVNASELTDGARLLSATARCGSFPTGPMRTDLLTGRLAFLSGEWALPRKGERTLIHAAHQRGLHCSLVTDNYVAVIPRIGGLLLDLFDSIDFVRGVAADPWATPTPQMIEAAQRRALRRPTRNVEFEAQYIANLRALGPERKPYLDVFTRAAAHLEALARHDRYLLWVDSFAVHEPWLSYEEICRAGDPPCSVFPAYTAADQFEEDDLKVAAERYAARVQEVLVELDAFLRMVFVTCGSDVAVVVLSDHGFLFGEYGFVGKAPMTPLPPELHNLCCWLSAHFAERVHELNGLSLQPHVLGGWIAEVLGIPFSKAPVDEVQLFGRNSPTSSHLAAADRDGMVLLNNEANACRARWLGWDELDARMRLWDHDLRMIPDETKAAVYARLESATDPWLRSFRRCS